MKISDILIEGIEDSKTLDLWIADLTLILNEYDNIANKYGRFIADQKLQSVIMDLDPVIIFTLLGDSDPITNNKYTEYQNLCELAKKKLTGI